MKLFLKPSLAILFAASVFMTTSCSNDDDPEPRNEEELITTLRLTMVPVGGGTTVTATYRDLDGAGGQVPIINNVTLAPNTTYDVTLAVLDESKTPAVDITTEIEEEGDEHQFFYVPSTSLNEQDNDLNPGTGKKFTVAYRDLDNNNRPIGIMTRMTTAVTSSGNLLVILKHQPGLKSATSTINTGETDVEVLFPVIVQ